jgi:exonuclease SbcC
MRINKIEIAGFGPYKTVQRVNFDAFRDDGIFLMSGKTGAGKSSILDAICFALYSSVPRYSGTETVLRSHHCDVEDPSYVTLEFTVSDTRYKVTRSPEYERPSKSRDGMMTQKTAAELFVFTKDQWEGIAARPVDVGNEIRQIVGLTKDQFLQVVLLAQNRFQEFLLAKNEARQTVLQTLFGTERFASYEAAIVAQGKALVEQFAQTSARMRQDAAHAAGLFGTEPPESMANEGWFTEGATALAKELFEVTARVTAASEVVTKAEAEHRALTDRRALQTRRDDAQKSLARVETSRADIVAARTRLSGAVHAATIEPYITTRDAHAAEAKSTGEREVSARTNYAEFGDREAVASQLVKAVDVQSRELGKLEGAIAEEATLPVLETELEGDTSTLAGLATELEHGAARAAELPAMIEEAAEKLTAARIEAGRSAEANATVARLESQLEAATKAKELAVKLTKAKEKELTAGSAHATTAVHHQQLLQRRLHGYAGELASHLVDNEACAVCGSIKHPAPAAASDDPVTQDDIDTASARVDALKKELDAASSRVRIQSEAHSASVADAAGQNVDSLNAGLKVAKGALNTATAATATASTLGAENTRLLQEQEIATAAVATLREKHKQAEISGAATKTSLTQLRARLKVHRGEYASVSERADVLRQTIEAATKLNDAIGKRETAVAALAVAEGKLAAQLVAKGFEDEKAASKALVEETLRAQLDANIRAHEQDEAIAKATLAGEGMTDLPTESIQTDDSARALDDAKTLLAEVTGQRGAVQQRHQQYNELHDEVLTRFAESAKQRAAVDDIESLALAVKGEGANARKMRLETYVLAAQLEEIVAAANTRLRTMTSGRYELQHDDSVQFRKTQSGLGLAIFDHHTGRARATHSLSGGENFLASLALALGLAEVVTNQSGGITLDTLFVDEGFGSLDGDTLEIAMGTLDGLRTGGRTIGLISHVGAMKERIAASLSITVLDGGWSEIVQQAP